jgi:hypothetical protein
MDNVRAEAFGACITGPGRGIQRHLRGGTLLSSLRPKSSRAGPEKQTDGSGRDANCVQALCQHSAAQEHRKRTTAFLSRRREAPLGPG